MQKSGSVELCRNQVLQNYADSLGEQLITGQILS